MEVREHELFKRRGDDLFCDVPISYEIAALGGEIQVPTVDGPARLKLGAGTENGKVFRLRGKGAPNVEGYGRGDLHVRVSAEVPVKLNQKQKKLFKELEMLRNESNNPDARKFQKKVDSFYEKKQAMRA
jgi:molecular chaperone DnaJ